MLKKKHEVKAKTIPNGFIVMCEAHGARITLETKKHSEQHRTKTAIKEEERRALVSKPEKLLKNEIAACVLATLLHVTFNGRPRAQQPGRSSRPASHLEEPEHYHMEKQKHKARKPKLPRVL